MAGFTSGKFRVILLTPTGRTQDCRCGSLILPSHDGHIGILRNHAPMLCKLGLGVMEVKGKADGPDEYYLIDGGFVRVAENNVMVLAYEVITFEGLNPEQANEMYRRASEVHFGQAYIETQKEGEYDREKAALIVKMGKMKGFAAS
jgi:F-type H+-transporting ATPase subunit epsilon